jgi:hypothetical protein
VRLAQRFEPEFPLAKLSEHPGNPRRGDEAAIDASMEAHGFFGAVLVQQSSGRIIAGNHRARVARRRGEATVPALILDCDDDQARRILLVDNRSNDRAGYDEGELAALLAELAGSAAGLTGTGYDEGELAQLLRRLEEPEPPGPPVRLADKFGAPPFSVLDGRAGYWRERKRRWLRWGLRSGAGRGENLLHFSEAARGSGWNGTSIFDPVLAELMLRWYCPPGGRVADPFCGGSVRGAVASALGSEYQGFDLRAEQIGANQEQGRALGLDPFPAWRRGDAREAAWEGSFDFLLTCPPYWGLERYSDDPADLSAAPSVEAFSEGLAACLAPAVDALAPDAFAVVVLGAMRAGERLVDLPGLGASALEQCGLMLYADFAYLTPLASAALRASAIFLSARKPVPVHQRVLVAVKGYPKAAAGRCAPLEAFEDEAAMASWLAEEEPPA